MVNNSNVMFIFMALMWLGFLSLVVLLYHSETIALLIAVIAYLVFCIAVGISLQRTRVLLSVNTRLKPVVVTVVVVLFVYMLFNAVYTLLSPGVVLVQKIAAISSVASLVIVSCGIVYYSFRGPTGTGGR